MERTEVNALLGAKFLHVRGSLYTCHITFASVGTVPSKAHEMATRFASHAVSKLSQFVSRVITNIQHIVHIVSCPSCAETLVAEFCNVEQRTRVHPKVSGLSHNEINNNNKHC
jgi:hypothetical protein